MQKVIDYLINNLKLKDGDVVVLGNSYGPDSMALMDILLNISKKIDISIVVAHVNHNVRSESIIEAKYVSDFCHKNGTVPMTVSRTPGLQAHIKRSKQVSQSSMRSPLFLRESSRQVLQGR